jgi:tetratricopeptide (TPR) repeat protein
MTSKWPGRAVLLLSLTLLIAACGSRTEDVPSVSALQEIPQPDLSAAQETVRVQIQEGEARIAELREQESAAAELAEAYGDLGLVYLTYSFLEASEACFENAQSLQPDSYRWPYILGYLFQVQGRLDEAESVLTRALELQADDLPSLIRLGTIRLELGDYDGAAAHFTEVVALDSTSAAGLNGLARVAAAKGDAARAVELFEQALKLQPQANSIRHGLGLAYRALGDRENARLNLERGGDAPVLFADPLLLPVAEIGRSAELFLVRGAQAFSEERYAQAAEFYRRALELDESDFTTHKALGFCLEKLGDLDGAIAQLDEALRSGTTGDDERDRLERSELYRIMGGLLVLQGRDQEAIAAFERSLSHDPDRLDTHMKLANALARNRRLTEALSHFDRILEELPENSNALMRRATILINLRRPQQALADFERAVAAAPEDAAIRLRFAEALEFLGRTSQANEQRKMAADLASGRQDRAALLLTESRSLVREGKIQAAIDKLRQALEVDSGYTDARYELGSLLGHQGRYDEAQTEFARVIEEVPWHRPARHGEITALLLQERYSEARTRLENGVEALPRDRGLAHGLTRLLAIVPVDSLRDGQAALNLARQLDAVGAGPETSATLAMAYAAAGRYEQAAIVQRQLIADAEAAGETQRAEDLKVKLAVFETHQAWEAGSPDEIIAAIVSAASSGRTSGS